MKRVLIFIGLVIFTGSLSAENLVFNPSFDMTPWDTGWTVYTFYKLLPGIAYVRADSSKWHSSPRSCYMSAGGGAGGGGTARVYQEVKETENCTCRIYYQYYIATVCTDEGCAGAGVEIFIKVSGEWKKEWGRQVNAGPSDPDTSDEVSVWTKWEKIYNDTVSGIKFVCHGGGGSSISMAGANAYFGIDDVYISGGTGIEEEDNEIANYRLQAYPNPFIRSTEFRVESSELKDSKLEILDVCGRVVRKLPIINNQLAISNVKWDGRGEDGTPLPGGIYFAKLSGKEENSTLKLILMR